MGNRAINTTTRPADTTAYTAGDVVLGALEFPLVGGNGYNFLTTLSLRIDLAAIPSGMTSFRLYLYDVTPPSALADNAVWDLPAGDRAVFLGYVDLGSPADLGSSLFTQVDQVYKHLKTSSTSVFGYLVTNGGFTPSASDVYTTTIYSAIL